MELYKSFSHARNTVNGVIGFIDGVPFYKSEYEFLRDRRTAEEYQLIKAWVVGELMPFMRRKYINEHHSSYGLKHTAQRELGMYVTNGDIKLALLELGVRFKKYPGSPNVCYPLSKRFYSVEGKGR